MTCYERLEFLGDAILDFCRLSFSLAMKRGADDPSGHPAYLRSLWAIISWCIDTAEGKRLGRI
jgi:hypothetical protein